MSIRTTIRAIMMCCVLGLAACGGGGSSGSSSTSASSSSSATSSSSSSSSSASVTYTIGGTVSGLTGSGLVLRNNTADNISVASNGAFVFNTNIASGGTYTVTVPTQPTSPAQTCTVTNGSGTVGNANITTISVSCTTIVASVGRFLYVPNANGSIGIYAINATTGALSVVSGGPSGSTNVGTPVAIAITPSGTFAYVASFNFSPGVYAFSINSTTGALTAVSGNPVALSSTVNTSLTEPYSIVIDPAGKFLYVADLGADNVLAYAINASTGALTPVSGMPFAAGSGPKSITIDPAGKFAYVANAFDGTVSAYTINASSGALTPVAGSPFAAGSFAGASGPESVAVDPTSKFVYVANTSDNTIRAYTLNASTGALTAVTGNTFVGGQAITVDPSGKFAYVTKKGTSGGVSIHTIDAVTGALTFVTTEHVPSGGGLSNALYTTLNPAGTFAYVLDSGSRDPVVYAVNSATGALTLSSAAQIQAASGDPRMIAILK